MASLDYTAAAPAGSAEDALAARSRPGLQVLLPVGFAVLAIAGWEILCRSARISPLLLPPPFAVWSVLSGNWGILMQEAVPTTLETIVSFVVATCYGVALAVAITFSVWVREALYPNIVMFQVIRRLRWRPCSLSGSTSVAGLHNVPEQLSFERPPVPDRIGPEVLFSQTCGYPFETILAGQTVQLGTPCYAAPGCDKSEIDPSTAMMFGPPAAAEVASV
jgi:hypothetical protein